MLFDYRKFPRALVAALLLMCLAIPAAHAEDDDDEEEGFGFAIVTNAKWKAECGTCHVAFPPHMLPVGSWRAVMAGLEKHFGSDASLDAATSKEIGLFLETYANRRGSEPTAKPLLRITESRWFRSEHREVSSRVWSSPKVKSPANCAACHTRAEEGRFGEHDIRIPRV
ncbi:MAG TPA: diheme cytochrome c [Gallionella sp.]|nr:diheme cytochrome c [Gallionella sp.]